MKIHSMALMAALSMGMGVAATRALEDEERLRETDLSDSARFRLGYKRPAPEPKIHTHSREIARRLRQQAAREAKGAKA